MMKDHFSFYFIFTFFFFFKSLHTYLNENLMANKGVTITSLTRNPILKSLWVGDYQL